MSHSLKTLFTTLLLTPVLAAPTSSSLSTSQTHSLTRRDGPCDAWSDDCRYVINGSACFAAYVTWAGPEQVLKCVDHEDVERAEKLVSILFFGVSLGFYV
jgi:hypothetical protein